MLNLLLARGADPPTTTELTKKMTVEQKKRNPGIQKAVEEGYIRREQVGPGETLRPDR